MPTIISPERASDLSYKYSAPLADRLGYTPSPQRVFAESKETMTPEQAHADGILFDGRVKPRGLSEVRDCTEHLGTLAHMVGLAIADRSEPLLYLTKPVVEEAVFLANRASRVSGPDDENSACNLCIRGLMGFCPLVDFSKEESQTPIDGEDMRYMLGGVTGEVARSTLGRTTPEALRLQGLFARLMLPFGEPIRYREISKPKAALRLLWSDLRVSTHVIERRHGIKLKNVKPLPQINFKKPSKEPKVGDIPLIKAGS